MFEAFSAALATTFSLEHLFITLWATLLGIVIGMLPGLTATMGLALLTTLTFKMEPSGAILALLCMYVGSIYGGSRSAIILNMPGTPASAATTLDGFPLARANRAREALALATIGSLFGTILGAILLALFAPVLADYALNFGAYEFFWLAVFGVLISGQLTAADDPLKGWIAGLLGLCLAMVGQEQVFAYPRFSFGITDLTGGINLIPAMVGAFGFAEILANISARNTPKLAEDSGRSLPRLKDIARHLPTVGRSGIIGTFIGVIPGVGEDIGAWSSYALAKRFSKNPEKYGKGSEEGLIAAETGNSAAVPGAIIPVLTLAIPGSAPSAVLLAAMIIHGVRPGPLIMLQNPTFVYEVLLALTMAAIFMTVYGLLLTRPLLMVLKVPRARLMPIIFVLCSVGSFAISGRLFDVWIMVAMGIAGFFLRQLRFPMAPLVLGLVLGQLLDKNLRRGLILSDGSLEPFLTRPISAVLVSLIVVCIIWTIFSAVKRARNPE